MAGAAGTLASYPFDLLRTTLAAQGEPKVYNSMAAAARAITRERGLAGLYSGVGITLVEIMPYAALQFGLFDALNGLWNTARVDAARKLKTRGGAAGGSGASSAGAAGGEGRGAGVVASVLDSQQVQHFTCGLLAGLCAKLATHPLDVAKKRYQVSGRRRCALYQDSCHNRYSFYGNRLDLTAILRQLCNQRRTACRLENVWTPARRQPQALPHAASGCQFSAATA